MGSTGLQMRVHHDAALADHARRTGQRDIGAQAHGAQYRIDLQVAAIGQSRMQATRGRICVQALHRGSQMPGHALPLQSLLQLFAGGGGQQQCQGPGSLRNWSFP